MYTNINKVLHAGISVKDMDESVEWYDRVLGFRKISEEYIPPMKTKIVFIRRDDLNFELELFQYDEEQPIPEDRLLPNDDIKTVGTKHIAFRIDNIDALAAGFRENEVEIVQDVRMNGNAVMFIHDCNGVLIEFIQG